MTVKKMRDSDGDLDVPLCFGGMVGLPGMIDKVLGLAAGTEHPGQSSRSLSMIS